jgi:hypothetical protein
VDLKFGGLNPGEYIYYSRIKFYYHGKSWGHACSIRSLCFWTRRSNVYRSVESIHRYRFDSESSVKFESMTTR